MSNTWESHLEQWTAAGLMEQALRDRIQAWESERQEPRGLRWPVRIALIFGGLLLGAGVLLFVSAHWDQLSPGCRLALVAAMVLAFHFGGAATSMRFAGLAITLHTVGTIALGAGIALAGQIFNMSEHWPAAVLMWAAGAAVAWMLLGHWTQGALTAILVPFWLAAEWSTRSSFDVPIWLGLCALSFVYLSARRGPEDSLFRKVLGWMGGISLLPAASVLAVNRWGTVPDWHSLIAAWAVAIAAPLTIAAVPDGRAAGWTAVAVGWTVLLAACNGGNGGLTVYLWCALGSVGLVWWGIHAARAERINLGIAGFALTVLVFYFSDVMNKLDRATGLMVAGLLFLGGGWVLERARRRLMAHMRMEVL